MVLLSLLILIAVTLGLSAAAAWITLFIFSFFDVTFEFDLIWIIWFIVIVAVELFGKKQE